jgi:hypothetical protein
MFDPKHPTIALFMSRLEASRAGDRAKKKYPDRVERTEVRPRKSKGELLGYQVVIHFKDRRPPTPLENSDFERLR